MVIDKKEYKPAAKMVIDEKEYKPAAK